ncbi:UDP-N-acetylglucosamine 1-carboxyvinyltransferase [Sneathiella sp. HT1-7]|jgi:UDP-N-acetylglucosamine 1-carboxyvinyltransferase|uniref:UDP-N-acetylglucosamine 1-carboxyvinyltransferase n=1 Tax=Sneathiella sp. HT1-7 TaxID=2887192 RepID=UPI001D1415EB|nr:UDP-N-acetylglucosamine 1-carboxyvinyltransferase [Sneathiella sp. HT1-7]MCC3304358.1 UDP-N-acetylglucosamine 1-carboxyvinyltransferase [Sneathiella sp. HT1-7]
MDSIRIRGGKPLQGKIEISGAKNAALPLMVASLLTEDTLTLSNLPHVADISTLITLLCQHGATAAMNGQSANGGGSDGRSLSINAKTITSTEAPYDIVRKMRAGALVMGPLLARIGKARVSLPGGCAIGTRPMNLHISGLEQMGAKITITGGYMEAEAPDGLKGAEIRFETVSVGATENLLMAASLAKGTTILENAAKEPEITDLVRLLTQMGANIEGEGTDRLVIHGVDKLHGTNYRVMPDRIETGTYAIAAMITGGKIELTNTQAELIRSVLDALIEAGAKIEETENGFIIAREGGTVRGVDIMTLPYPGYPTDMQAQFMALMTVAGGAAMITETIFENRFMHVPELARLGANITVHGHSALVRGVDHLVGAPVMATDLRASVSLVLAGLAAEGETVINRVYHLDRGYERLEEKLAACGADIERIQLS